MNEFIDNQKEISLYQSGNKGEIILYQPEVCKDFLHTTQHGAIVGKTQVKSIVMINERNLYGTANCPVRDKIWVEKQIIPEALSR